MRKLGLLDVCFTAVATLLIAACGTDGTVAGPSLEQADAGTTGDAIGDGAGSSSSGASSGGSSGGTSSGGASGGGVCGDGTCNATENLKNCPLDCKESSTGPLSCIKDKCAKQVTECESEDSCSVFLGCVAKCETSACVGECALFAPTVTKPMQRVMQCARDAKCVVSGGEPPAKCGDGQCNGDENAKSCPQDCKTAPTDICGDGICANSESPKSCAKDCGTAGPWCGNGKCEGPVESPDNCAHDCAQPPENAVSCAQKQCPQQFQECLKVGPCAEVVKCIAGCSNDQCLNKCVQSAQSDPSVMKVFGPLATCAAQHGCGSSGPPAKCGNGNCEAGENPNNCKQDCKAPPGAICGDGKCQNPENAKTCAKDCDEPAPQEIVKCVATKCQKQWATCSASKACATVLSCLKGCGNSGQCMEKCIDSAPQSSFAQLMPVLSCAETSGCIPGGGGGQCGDGQCDDNESPQSCPSDCSGDANGTCQGKCGGKGQGGQCFCDQQCGSMGDCCNDFKKFCGDTGPQCGNGKCEEGENAKSCPKDCSDTKPVCGNGKCEAPFENATNCAQDCKDTKPICGNGKCEAPFETTNNCKQDCQPTKPVCGDGKCTKGSEDALSCPKDCTKPGGSCKESCGGNQGGCWCDKVCVNQGDCCPDYKQYCAGTTIVCGDGQCTAPQENSSNCPADCKGDAPKTCATIKDCNDGQICCNKGDAGKICVKSGTCG